MRCALRSCSFLPRTLAKMTPTEYHPLSTLTFGDAIAPQQLEDDFMYEAKTPAPAPYSTISGEVSHSIPRKPLRLSDTTPQTRPLGLARPWYITLTQGVLDIVLGLAPITFFALAWCAFTLSGKEVSAWGASVQQWSLVVCNIFYPQPVCTDMTAGAHGLSDCVRRCGWPLDECYCKLLTRTGCFINRMLL